MLSLLHPIKAGSGVFVQLISHLFLYIIQMTHWLLPFSNRTEMEKPVKESTHSCCPQGKFDALGEQNIEGTLVAPSTHFPAASSWRLGVPISQSTLLNLLLVRLPTPPRLQLLRDRTLGAGLAVAVPIENLKWLYTQSSVPCSADASHSSSQ